MFCNSLERCKISVVVAVAQGWAEIIYFPHFSSEFLESINAQKWGDVKPIDIK